jgi:hypothetical protein
MIKLILKPALINYFQKIAKILPAKLLMMTNPGVSVVTAIVFLSTLSPRLFKLWVVSYSCFLLLLLQSFITHSLR